MVQKIQIKNTGIIKTIVGLDKGVKKHRIMKVPKDKPKKVKIFKDLCEGQDKE